MERNIKWSENESITLLSGFRGNGKSTELRRLRNLLQDEQNPKYTVLLCDVEGFINEHTPIGITDFFITLVAVLNKYLAEKYSADFTKTNSLKDFLDFFQRFSGDIDLGVIKMALQAPATMNDPSFKQEIQKKLKGSVENLVKAVRQFMDQVAKFLRESENDQLVLIVDSVEKIRGRGTDAHEVYESVEFLFKRYWDKLKIPHWHIVYTVPPYIPTLALEGDGNMCPLLSVHIFNQDGTIDQKGINIMKNVIYRRFDKWQMIFSDKQLEEIILSTGGDFRGFFRLIRSVLRKININKEGIAEMPVNEGLIESAKNNLRTDMLPIPESDLAWLQAIHKSGKAELQNQEELPRFIRFLDNNLVFTYQNGDSWYGVNPLLREYLEKRKGNKEE